MLRVRQTVEAQLEGNRDCNTNSANPMMFWQNLAISCLCPTFDSCQEYMTLSLVSLTQADNKKEQWGKGDRKCSLERKGALDSLCYSPGCAGREAITVNEISPVRGASCSAPGQSRVPWASPSQLPACERERLQVSAPEKQLLTKAATVRIPGAQGPSQPSSQSAAVFFVVVTLEAWKV